MPTNEQKVTFRRKNWQTTGAAH